MTQSTIIGRETDLFSCLMTLITHGHDGHHDYEFLQDLGALQGAYTHLISLIKRGFVAIS